MTSKRSANNKENREMKLGYPKAGPLSTQSDTKRGKKKKIATMNREGLYPGLRQVGCGGF